MARNAWRDSVVEVWRAAYDQWLLDLEAASNGFATEAAEFRESHPCPRLADFLKAMSHGNQEAA